MRMSLAYLAMEDRIVLVLSRKVGQRIEIGDDVVVTVTGIKGNRIQLGIDAPKEVSIRRSELKILLSNVSDETSPRQQVA